MGQATQAGNLASQLGGSVLGSIVGEGMGLLFSGVNNDIQAQQQQRLTDIQLNANEQLSAYNYAQQLQMWNQTNYPAQVEQLEKAGLNPALLYGKTGGGGATTGTPSGGIGIGTAPGTTPIQTAQLAIQSQEAQADINLKNAQAQNISAKTPQEAGLMNATINSITQGVQNQQAQQALTQAQTTTQNLENQITGQTIDDQIASIRAASSTVQTTLQQAVRNNYMDQQTMNDKIATIHGAMLGTFIQNQLTQNQAGQTAAQTTLTQEQTTQIANSIAQQWKSLEIQAHNAHINQINAETLQQNADTNTGWLQLEKILKDTPDSGAQMMQMLTKIIPSFNLH